MTGGTPYGNPIYGVGITWLIYSSCSFNLLIEVFGFAGSMILFFPIGYNPPSLENPIGYYVTVFYIFLWGTPESNPNIVARKLFAIGWKKRKKLEFTVFHS